MNYYIIIKMIISKIKLDYTLFLLYKNDIDKENVILIPYYPKTENESKYYINLQYISDYELHLIAMKNLFISGDFIVYLKNKSTNHLLLKYWENYLQDCPKLKNILNYYNVIDMKYIVLFPYSHLSENQHLINPNIHYELLSKETIIYINVNQPKSFVFNVITDSIDKLNLLSYPYVIKTTQGLGGFGTWIIKNEKDFLKAMEQIKYLNHEKLIISEFIENVISNYCLQFYLSKNEENDVILGITRQIIDPNSDWKGGYINYKEQNKLKEKLKNIFKTVSYYLRKKMFFGIVGVDILEDINNNLYVVDLNLRINGTTPLCLIKNHFNNLNIKYSCFFGEIKFKGIKPDQLINSLKQYFDNYKIILLGITENNDNSISTYMIISGDNLDQIYKFKNSIKNKISLF